MRQLMTWLGSNRPVSFMDALLRRDVSVIFHKRSTLVTLISILTLLALLLALIIGVVGPGALAAFAQRTSKGPHFSPTHIHPRTSATPGSLIWSLPIAGQPYYQGSIAENGAVYTASTPDFYALNPTTGAMFWRYQPSQSGYPLGAFTYSAGKIALGEDGDNSTSVLSAQTGTVLWQHEEGDNLATEASNGVLYLKDYSGRLTAVNLTTGTLIWYTNTCGTGIAAGLRIIVANGLVYTFSDNSSTANTVCATNATNGQSVWSNSCGTGDSQFYGGIDLSNGTVFLSSGNTLCAFNAVSGSEMWSYSLPSSFDGISPPTAQQGTIYFGTAFGYVYALNASSGTVLWNRQLQNSEPYGFGVEFAPTVSNGVVYGGIDYVPPNSGNHTYQVFALTATAGTVLWSYTVVGSVLTPAVANGTVYASTEGGTLYALAASSPQQPPAQGPTGPERLGDTNPSELGYCRTCAGDPIDTASGDFTHTFADLSIAGRGIPLAFTRTYNAQAATTKGVLGYGWTDSYAWSLSTDGSGNVTIAQENGSTVTFSPPSGSGGAYTPPSRVLATLDKHSDGSYTFTRANQTSYTFNASGQLTQEQDRNGYITRLSYNSSGQLTTVTDPAGRTLTFAYNSAGQLTSVTDPLARKASFAYDGSGNLASATDVNGGKTTFTYDANHLLLTMTDPRGGVTT